MTNGVTLPFLSSKRAYKWRENVLSGLEGEISIQDDMATLELMIIILVEKCSFEIANDMRVICNSLFQRENKHITKLLITLGKHFTYRYHFNILISISIIYHFYIVCELYN